MALLRQTNASTPLGGSIGRHPVKRIALAVTVVGIALAAAVFATAGSAQGPATRSLHLVSTPQESVGFQPKHRELRPGDRVGGGDRITGDDTGIDRATCTWIGKQDALCTAVVQLSKGTLTGEALVNPGERVSHYAVTGGTGAYAGANGSAVVSDIPNTVKTDIQITLLP
jgi:hypothetical protein